MSESARRILYLLIDGLPEEQRPALPTDGSAVEVFTLTVDNACEALDRIFAADAVSVWGKVDL